MPGPYGVTDAGFSVKTLPEQLAELEIANQASFGSGVIQDSQSPLGQLNALFADATSEIWEMAQDLYGSFDVDQARGVRLDALGKLRRVPRTTGQSDADYRLAITQAGYGNSKTRNLRSKLLEVDGVTFVQIVENSTPRGFDNGLPSHSLAIIVEGGSNGDVAEAIWLNTAPGIGLFGNRNVSITVDGFCRTVAFIRPSRQPLILEIDVSIHLDRCECAPASVDEIVSSLVEQTSGDCGLVTGTTVTPAMIEQIVAMNPGVVVEEVRMTRTSSPATFRNVAYKIEQLPEVTAENISLTFTSYNGPTTTQGSSNAGFTPGGIAE